jgi:hypothetical protein
MLQEKVQEKVQEKGPTSQGCGAFPAVNAA